MFHTGNDYAMALPATVAELCLRAGVPRDDVQVPCVFCGGFLTFTELCEFDAKCMRLRWKDGRAFGCCVRCACIVGKAERDRFLQASVVGIDLVRYCRGGFLRLTVRCWSCLRLMGATEKVSAVLAGQSFDLVRGRWRARCRFCP
ncbi:E6 [Ailuropoda melanoleuca papillomavirus 4]|uniref:Protein E6 n=1 Tax=Ailuropoda melanoleuca papillomavirus 4 TaxID=2016453 RepID=A0A220IGE9_9PAPI|nr:E6 [Ailuropoda melanoleuca papillomavirus 4]